MDTIFKSFFAGGFECSHMEYTDHFPQIGGRKIDVIGGTKHDEHCHEDYRLLRSVGIDTVRDGLRWPLIETAPGRYDFSSWQGQLDAMTATGMQVIWDLNHYTPPPHGDFWSADFPARFADYAFAAGEKHKATTGAVPIWCPMNEINYWGWLACEDEKAKPGPGDRHEFYGQAILATIAGQKALRTVDPRARFIQCEYFPYTVGLAGQEERAQAENGFAENIYDMLAGRTRPELGGSEDMLDMIGMHFYDTSTRLIEENGNEIRPLPRDNLHFPHLRQHLIALHDRYQRPVLVTECGAPSATPPGPVTLPP